MRRAVFLVLTLTGGIALAQTRPAFDVASVKPCHDGEGYTGITNSSTRLTMGCLPLETFIEMAYIQFGDGHFDPFSTTLLEGGPAWIKRPAAPADRYAIDAETSGPTAPEVMRGPMMQTLLEERFHLKVHREMRQVHIFALTVDKGGTRLKPFDGSCTPPDFTKVPQSQPAASNQKPPCGGMTFRGDPVTMDLHGVPMARFADALDTVAERIGIIDGPVVDRTALTDRFDIHLEFANDSGTGDAIPANGQSLFTALRDQLGLKLERTTGPREFIVVDHIEKASEN